MRLGLGTFCIALWTLTARFTTMAAAIERTTRLDFALVYEVRACLVIQCSHGNVAASALIPLWQPLLQEVVRESLSVLLVGEFEDAERSLWRSLLPRAQIFDASTLTDFQCGSRTFDIGVVKHQTSTDDIRDTTTLLDEQSGCAILDGGMVFLAAPSQQTVQWMSEFADILNDDEEPASRQHRRVKVSVLCSVFV